MPVVKSMFCIPFVFACAVGAAHADIFRYVNEDGQTVFSDMAPQSGKYEVVVKSAPKPVAAPAPSAAAPDYVEPTPRERMRLEAMGVKRARYAAHINEAARVNNIDPALVHAVISAESSYNDRARSPKGAIGLMQLMPDTARRYAVSNIWDPIQNIHGGTRYLADLLRMFNNDHRLAVAAYNAGEKAVMKYGNRIPPYAETVAYVPKVMTYYRKYSAGF
jgi:soluble lytic murein transglycosylase-like protein